MAPRLSRNIKREPPQPALSSSASTSSPSHPFPSPPKPVIRQPAPATFGSTITTEVPPPDAHMLTPPPSSARTELALRMGDISMNSPIAERGAGGMGKTFGSNNASSISNSNSYSLASALQTGSFSAQNRAILLAGLPESPTTAASKEPYIKTEPHAKSMPALSPSSVLHPSQRREPLAPLQRHRLTPLVTVSGTASPQQQQQQQQHYHQHHPLHSSVPYSPGQSPRTLSACVYVRATGLRRMSSAASSVKAEADAANETPPSSSTSTGTSRRGDALSHLTPPPEGRLFVAAHVTPANPEHEPFVLQREFDLQELLGALPRPDRRGMSSVSILPSPIARSPLSARPGMMMMTPLGPLGTAPTPASTPVTGGGTRTPTPTSSIAAGVKRPASDHSPHTPGSPHPSLRRQQQQQQHVRQLSQKDMPSPDQFLVGGGIPIPIRPHPSLGGLPGLAAIVLSRRVQAGDMIELPLPHPEAWPQTVSYVYKSHGKLTEEVQRNILHLGGTCD